MQKIQLIGHLGQAASLKQVSTVNGPKPVVNFSLAVAVGYGAKQETAWYDCAWWGERAEKCAGWLIKGKQVYIEGEPGVRMFTKRDGTAGCAVTVNVRDLNLLGGARDNRVEGPSESGTETKTILKDAPAEDVPY